MSVRGLNRPNPDLKNLLFATQVRIRSKLKHAARKVFDVNVVAVIQAARFAQALIEIAVAGTMLSEIGLHHRQRRPVFIRARDVDRKTKRDRGGARFALNDFDLGSGFEFRLG